MAVQQGDTVNGVEIRPMAGRDFQPVGSSASYDWAQATIVAPGYTYQAGDQIQFSLHGEHASIYGQPGVQTQSVSVDSVAHTADVKFQSSTPGSVTVSAVLTRDSSVSGSRIFTFMAIPIASRTTLGAVMVGDGLSITEPGVLSATGSSGAPYTLPPASAKTLGGVKQGGNVTIASDGTLSVAAPYTLPVATRNALGGVKQGTNVTIEADGTLSVAGGTAGTLPTASPSVKGGVKVGTGLSMNGETMSVAPATAMVVGGVKQGGNVTIAWDGTLSVAAPYTLPVATGNALGGVKQGTNVTIEADGTLSVAGGTAGTLPTASPSVKGGVKVGTGLSMNGETMSVAPATAAAVGGVKQGGNVRITSDGTLSVDTSALISQLPHADANIYGVVKPGTGMTAIDGVLSVAVRPSIFRPPSGTEQGQGGFYPVEYVTDLQDGDTYIADTYSFAPRNVVAINADYNSMKYLHPGARIYFWNKMPAHLSTDKPVFLIQRIGNGGVEVVTYQDLGQDPNLIVSLAVGQQGVLQWLGNNRVAFYVTAI
jgi:hypothetical protein